MTTLIVKPRFLDFHGFHEWLDDHSPGWSWKLTKRTDVAFSLHSGSVVTLEWVISSELSMIKYFGEESCRPTVVHYKVRDNGVAMLAVLSWPGIKVWKPRGFLRSR